MIKKLDILIVRAFIGPFIATFFITLFVLILQFFWLWIDDFVGKGVDGPIFLRLIVYLSATLVPLALPLAILLSSIMTFGNLGETFELVAIKSAGIGLLRFMRPLLIISLLLSGLAFLFNNNVIPVANLKMRSLHTDIVNKKPAFDLKEGVFYTTIPGYAIKVGEKKNDSTLINVIIYETSPHLQDNIIVADRGIMQVSADQRFLVFTLKDGWRYEERGQRSSNNTDFIRLGFKEYKKVLDLSSLQLNITSDTLYKDRYEMLSVRQLGKGIDSLEKRNANFRIRVQSDLEPFISFNKVIDSGWVKVKPQKADGKTVLDMIPDTARKRVLEQSISYASSIKNSLQITAMEYNSQREQMRMQLIEWHNKFTMALAVFVLFLIGAPLGSIVRKGGIGTPVVFAVVFFVIFFLLNNFGKKFVKEDLVQPVSGMWMATFILLPIGVFLTYKAMHDSQLMNKEFYFRFFRKIKNLFVQRIKSKQEELT
ncbi:MAG: LptF/LptG family permease [Chitinophagaceae bacterium]|nr:LptF/LptG family permease [Chitinophagaceae bacterium]